jgi:hypothetical protein
MDDDDADYMQGSDDEVRHRHVGSPNFALIASF